MHQQLSEPSPMQPILYLHERACTGRFSAASSLGAHMQASPINTCGMALVGHLATLRRSTRHRLRVCIYVCVLMIHRKLCCVYVSSAVLMRSSMPLSSHANFGFLGFDGLCFLGALRWPWMG